MKTVLLSLLVLFATAAFGQSGGGTVLSNEPQEFNVPSHPETAIAQPLAQGRNLLEPSGFSYAQGERPLWVFAPKHKEPMSLGEIARMLRKEHEATKKAEKVWTN
jgi:hypothetical protein